MAAKPRALYPAPYIARAPRGLLVAHSRPFSSRPSPTPHQSSTGQKNTAFHVPIPPPKNTRSYVPLPQPRSTKGRPAWPSHVQARQMATTSTQTDALPQAPFPIIQTVADFRQWRAEAFRNGKTVGFVPTMGALHEGHLSLVRQSLAENDLTVVSIFVNPAQFAPTEDLASYPRTLPSDLDKLLALQKDSHGVAAIFAPTVPEMYPSPDGKPFTQHKDKQVGAFVEVQGLQSQMEGASRPQFFRGVATVCTKLFHIVQPDLAYFGQKDIQQAIILRRLVSDLLFAYPPSQHAVRVIPTSRDPVDGLALSSRNTYLTPTARKHATALYEALQIGRKSVQEAAQRAAKDNVVLDLLYIALNDPVTLGDLESSTGDEMWERGAILSGAAMIKEGQQGRATRLIDNELLGWTLSENV